MKVLGVDIDGTLLGDGLSGVVSALTDEIVSGSDVILVTARVDARAAQVDVWNALGINLPCVSIGGRSWPHLKGKFLLDYRDRRLPGAEVELWDDEPWYLNPAALSGVECRRVVGGVLEDWACEPGYVRYVSAKPEPDGLVLLPML